MSLFDKKKKNLIVKANQLVEARYRLTANEQKIILAMVAYIQPDDEDFKKYRFNVTELAEFMGIKHKSIYGEMVKITTRLRKRDVNIYNPKEKTLVNTGWLSSSKYYFGEGSVDLCFDPELKPYLLGLKENFVKYKPEVIKQIHSGYSIRIYELLKQYEKIGKRKFNLSELRNILAIKDDEYKRYYNFKVRILDTAKKDINENTDIKINFKEIRKGQKVESIEFTILVNAENKEVNKAIEIVDVVVDIKPLNGLHVEGQIIFNRLVNYYLLSHLQAKEVVEKYPKTYLIEQMKNIEGDFGSKDIRNKGAYAYKAIIDGYNFSQSQFDTEKQAVEIAKGEKEKSLKEWEVEHSEELKRKLESVKAGVGEDDQAELVAALQERYKNNKLMLPKFQKDGLNNPFVLADYEKLIIEKFLKPEDYNFLLWVKTNKGRELEKDELGNYRFIN